jgi:hypothetical protein
MGLTIVHLERFFEIGTEISFYFEHKHDDYFHSPPQADAITASVLSVFGACPPKPWRRRMANNISVFLVSGACPLKADGKNKYSLRPLRLLRL